jgi:hypothetical protein
MGVVRGVPCLMMGYDRVTTGVFIKAKFRNQLLKKDCRNAHLID